MELDESLQIMNYYNTLEEQTISIISMVPFTTKNLDTEIPSIAPIIVETGSLIDTIFRSKSVGRRVFQHYQTEFSIEKSAVIFINHPLQLLSPFKNCIVDTVFNEPVWWNAYNSLKHRRLSNLEKANIGNLINILCALFLVISQDITFFEALLINDLIRTNYYLDFIKSGLPRIYEEERQRKNNSIGIESRIFYTEIGLTRNHIIDPYKYRNYQIKTKYLYRYY